MARGLTPGMARGLAPGRALGLASVLIVAGCSGSPADSAAPGDGGAGCDALMGSLPGTIGNVGERVDARPAYVAAWADPPVILRCGVPTPAELKLDSQVITVNGVDWFVDQRADVDVATTYGRRTNVEVTVPDEHRPTPEVLVDLAAAVSRSIAVNPEE